MNYGGPYGAEDISTEPGRLTIGAEAFLLLSENIYDCSISAANNTVSSVGLRAAFDNA